jgi:hypothetical protein
MCRNGACERRRAEICSLLELFPTANNQERDGAMSYPYVRLCAVSAIACLFDTAARAAPAANLPLTCSSASAIAQPQNNCNGAWAYKTPSNDQLVVLKGPASAPTWALAANVAGTEAIAVCSLPVEPGGYSNCKDSSGVRRIVYLAKNQVFFSSPPPPPPAGARVLDLSRTPAEITEPGVYVLSQNWVVSDLAPPNGIIVITANGVTLDLQGFELVVDGNTAIVSSGNLVYIRNGWVHAEGGTAIRASGPGTYIEHIYASVGSGTAVDLGGRGSTLTESTATAGLSGIGLRLGDDTVVRNTRISGRTEALIASSRTVLTNNEIQCIGGGGTPCIDIEGTDNIFSANRINEGTGSSVDALVLRGSFNHAMDNVFTMTCDSPPRGSRAIIVEGQGNTIRDNLVPSCSGSAVWEAGIVFLQNGNFYGDNIVWATVPFNVGATVQTDLGGNNGFAP